MDIFLEESIMDALEQARTAAEEAHRQAFDYVFYDPAANAREIAESIDEPSILIEQIILAMNATGSMEGRYDEVEALISLAVNAYANEQAEAAYDHVMRTPS